MACTKKTYYTEQSAKAKVQTLAGQGVRQHDYQCPHCDHWHLTSMTKKEFRAAERRRRRRCGIVYGGIESLRE